MRRCVLCVWCGEVWGGVGRCRRGVGEVWGSVRRHVRACVYVCVCMCVCLLHSVE